MDHLTLTPHLSRLTSFHPPEVTDKNRILIQDILRQNPLLEDLSIEYGIDIPEEKEAKTRDMVKAMLGLKRLTTLFFKNNWVTGKLLESLVWGLPKLSFLSFGTMEFRPHIEQDLMEKGVPSDDVEDYLEGDELDSLQRQRPLLLDTVQMDSPGRLFSSMVKILQSCPSLTYLIWNESDEHFNLFAADLQSLARAIHKGCPRLNSVFLSCEWMQSGDLYQLLSLWDPLLDNPQLSWLPMTSITLYLQSMETVDVLGLVWDGRDVLQYTLEYLDAYSLGIGRRAGGPIAISILETFQKLQSLIIPGTIVDAKLFFHQVSSFQHLDSGSEGPIEDVFFVGDSDGGDSYVGDSDDDDKDEDSDAVDSYHSLEIKVWACDSLRRLELQIQGAGPSWCPPEVLRAQSQKDSVANVNGYPLFDPLKAYLDELPQLDQSKIQYSVRSPFAPSVSPPADSDPEY